MEYCTVDYNLGASDTLVRLREHGIFLCTRSRKGDGNAMTIGWGTVATIWGLPLFTVLVRPSRHTFSNMEDMGEFTICVPHEGRFKEALALCGTKSGRDVDKFREASLDIREATAVNAPIIMGSQWIYQCRVIYKQALDPRALDQRVAARYYGNGDFHTVYYGEILEAQGLVS